MQIMAKYMREIFGEKLCVDVDPSLTEMPSPDMLKHKILIKVRAGDVSGAEYRVELCCMRLSCSEHC